MKHWLFEALLLFLAAYYQANGVKITNSTNSAHAQTDGQTVVCNQYIGTDVETNDAIKKLDEKLDQIIKLLQTSPNPSKIIAFKNILHLETDKNSFLLDYKLKKEQNDTTKVSLEKFRSFSFRSFFLSLLFFFVYSVFLSCSTERKQSYVDIESEEWNKTMKYKLLREVLILVLINSLYQNFEVLIWLILSSNSLVTALTCKEIYEKNM